MYFLKEPLYTSLNIYLNQLHLIDHLTCSLLTFSAILASVPDSVFVEWIFCSQVKTIDMCCQIFLWKMISNYVALHLYLGCMTQKNHCAWWNKWKRHERHILCLCSQCGPHFPHCHTDKDMSPHADFAVHCFYTTSCEKIKARWIDRNIS